MTSVETLGARNQQACSTRTPWTKRERILLIEDNPDDALFLRRALESVPNLELIRAETLAEGTALLESDPAISLVFSDLGLPDSDGAETADAILHHAADKPVIIMTGSDDLELGEDMILRGAQDYLVKGEFSLAHARRVLRHAIVRKNLEKELFAARRAAEQASLAKGEFLAEVSHEIRTPLNVILGLTEVLMDESWTNTQSEQLQTMKRAGDSLLSLINSVLDLSKIEAGRLDLVQADFDISELLENFIDLVALPGRKKGVSVSLDLVDPIPCVVTGDSNRLLQVLTNLAWNALKFTESGGFVKVEVQPHARDQIRFSVQDSGIGMTEEELLRVFDAYEQGSGGRANGSSSTGLGLPLCQKLVSLMGGDLRVDSQRGEGSEFHFAIPLSPKGQRSWPAPSDGKGEQRSVLVAIRDDQERGAAIRALRHSGWLASAANGPQGIEQALDRSPTNGFQACLLDCFLMDELAESTIDKLRRSVTRVKVAVLPSPRETDLLRCGQLGFEGTIARPLTPSRLQHGLHRTQSSALRDQQAAECADGRLDPSARILVVDDVKDNRSVVEAFLQSTNHRLDFADSGERALEKFRPGAYDIVLLDMRMPGISGLETARRMRLSERDSDHSPARIIALTADAFEENHRESAAAGCDLHLSKPIQRRTLLRALEDASPRPEETVVEVEPEIAALLPSFLKNREKDVRQARQALGSDDFESVETLGHNIKGNGSVYGLPLLSHLGRQLEAAAQSRKSERITSCLNQIADLVKHTMANTTGPTETKP